MTASPTPFHVLLPNLWRRMWKSDVVIVGIDGPGGAGKSTLAAALARETGAQVVHLDDAYRSDRRQPQPVGDSRDLYDLERVVAELLEPIRAGRVGRLRRYDWDLDELLDETIDIEPLGLIIIEGVTALSPELRGFLDLGVWVSTPPRTRLDRGLERDARVDGADALWRDYWEPANDAYMREHEPHLAAHVVIDGTAVVA